MRRANLLSKAWGRDRFPIDVKLIAQDISARQPDPIARIHGGDIGELEGMLLKREKGWYLLYNDLVQSSGRINFTIGHEFGHYLLHRHRQDRFACGDADIETGDRTERDIEAEADLFASTLLMPLDDFRRQVGGQPVSFDLLGHCADRYGVSLTAAALRWTEIAEQRAVLVASRDDHMLWAKSSKAAFRSGAFFATRKHTLELPREALAHSTNGGATSRQQTLSAQRWFPREPASMSVTEMTMVAGQYDYTLTLLLMPEAEWQGAHHEDGEPLEDTPPGGGCFTHRND